MRYPAQAQHIELSQDDQMMQFSCSFTHSCSTAAGHDYAWASASNGKKQQSYTERMCDAGLRQYINIDDVAAISSISYMYQQLTGRTKRRQQCIRKILVWQCSMARKVMWATMCTFIPAAMDAFRGVQEVQLDDLVLVLIAPAHHHCPLLACR